MSIKCEADADGGLHRGKRDIARFWGKEEKTFHINFSIVNKPQIKLSVLIVLDYKIPTHTNSSTVKDKQ